MKKKMSNTAFRKLWCVILAIIIILTLIANTAAYMFRYSLDTYLGRGERKVITNQLGQDDAEFYHAQYTDTDAEAGSVSEGLAVSKAITDEGEVLMKNNGVLPLEHGSNISVFGYRYLTPVYGGSGSGNVDANKAYVATAEKSLSEHFNVNQTLVSAMKKAVPQEITAMGISDATSSESGKGFNGASTSILEFDPQIYKGLEESCADTTGIVFIGRVGGEGSNLQITPYSDGTAHELQLTTYERDMLRFAKEHCKNVVVIINSSNVMELGELVSGELEADAILWIGGPGATGFDSMARILDGEVNPSGRTVDLWEADLTKNPTYKNFENRTYTNTADTNIASNYKGLYYLELEEGIYIGYRYYETAADLGYLDYEKSVVFPFGFGLSYTTFEQELKQVTMNDGVVTVTVEVTNTGTRDGKDTVQLYYTPPYTKYDEDNGIEKATKNLVAFDKVFVKAGASETVTLTFMDEDMASYTYTHDNGDGTTGCWMLEKGDYALILGKDSHNSWGTDTITISDDIFYTNANPRQSEIAAQSALDEKGNLLPYPEAVEANKDAKYIAATNQFDDVTEYMLEQTTMLSRKDWNNTQPTSPEDKELSPERLAEAANFDPETDLLLGNVPGSAVYTEELPAEKALNGLSLADMRGKGYYDPNWELLLDQVDYSSDELNSILYMAAFSTGKVTALGKPESVDHDGPQGWGLTGASGGPDTCAYPTEVVVASAWNTDLAYDYGKAIGQEALTIGYTGWYGPGINIHRSAFVGRNFEYYSEDPLLSGKLAARCISGAADQGVICYMKHFVANEYEGPSCSESTWLTEQALREIYLKAFEIPVKEARMTIQYIADSEGTMATRVMKGCTGVMAAANMLGTKWCTANYPLLTNVLRNEWGYQGVISSDMFLQCSPNITIKAYRAGANLKMWYMPPTDGFLDLDSPIDRTVVRNALKNVCYAYANSNLMQGVAPGSSLTYSMSPWNIALIAVDIIIAAFVIVMTVVMIRRKEPETL